MKRVELSTLEQKIDALISICSRLSTENLRLQHDNATLKQQRDALQDKNHAARARIETMLERLKEIEEEVEA